MQWESGDIYKSLRDAIVAAKDPKRDFLKEPAIVAPLARLVELNTHGYFAREGAGPIAEIRGWKKIDEVRRKNGFLTNLDMEVWQKGNATVASIMSVWSPLERNGDDIDFAVNKIKKSSNNILNLVLVGHGDKGSTAVLAAAQQLGENAPPTLALEPFLPKNLNLHPNAPVVGVSLTANTTLNNLFSASYKGLTTRSINGADVAGTGKTVATNWMNSIDARAYYAALGIAAVKATGEHDYGSVVNPPVQPWIVRAFNPDSGASDPRLKMIEDVKHETPGKRSDAAASTQHAEYKPYMPSLSAVNDSKAPKDEPSAAKPATPTTKQAELRAPKSPGPASA